VNTIQCGTSATTKQVWEAIAQRGQGQYFLIPQDGGVQTISTPYDERLSQLGTRLGGTFLAYGGGAGAEGEHYRAARKEVSDRVKSSVAASSAPTAAADRSLNKALNSKAYIGDLLQDIENGSTKLESVKSEDLPSELQKLSAEDRARDIEKRLAERKEIRKQSCRFPSNAASTSPRHSRNAMEEYKTGLMLQSLRPCDSSSRKRELNSPHTDDSLNGN